MELILVYSNKPAPAHPEFYFTTDNGICCYTIPICTEHDMRCVLEFIYNAVVAAIVDCKLSEKRITDGNGVFAQRLSAYFYVTGIKSELIDILSRILDERGVINIDGVVKFRLGEFSDEISAFFEFLFYELNIRKGYDDFVAMAKAYISAESSKEDVIHVVFKKDGISLLNTTKTDVTKSAMKSYRKDVYPSEVSVNDFLISSLMYFIPKRIIIHTEGKNSKRRIIHTIKAIFGERVRLCECCEMCVTANSWYR